MFLKIVLGAGAVSYAVCALQTSQVSATSTLDVDRPSHRPGAMNMLGFA